MEDWQINLLTGVLTLLGVIITAVISVITVKREIYSAKANGLNPEKYLEYVLNAIFEKKDPKLLLPWDETIPDYIKEPF